MPTDGHQTAETAVSRLLDDYGGRIYRLALLLCGNVQDAEDLVQETFLAAFRKWSQFEGRAKATTWLYTIATRACTRRRRKRAGEPQQFDSLSASDAFQQARALRAQGDGPLDTQLRREVVSSVEHAIAALPEHYRLPLVLKDIHGLTVVEIGAILGLQTATVKTRLHRGRLRLREMLGGDLPARGPATDVDRQRCLDLLKVKQESLDKGVDLDIDAEHICQRCRHLFAELDLGLETCHALDRGTLPDRVRALLRDRLHSAL